MLEIALEDIRRGTLSVNSGNEGWIGVSPDGTQYHLVVPVDAQIARGVMAGNRPSDGTPFGGYTGWLYFRCAPYVAGSDEQADREEQVRCNASNLLTWLAEQGVLCRISHQYSTPLTTACDQDLSLDASVEKPVATCEGCGVTFSGIVEVLQDASLKIRGYRAFPDDFKKGMFLFTHGCKGEVSVGVRHFARPQTCRIPRAALHNRP